MYRLAVIFLYVDLISYNFGEFISFNNLLWIPLYFLCIRVSADVVSISSSFPIGMPFVSFSCLVLANTSTTVFNISGESRHPFSCFWSYKEGFNYFIIQDDVNFVFHKCHFLCCVSSFLFLVGWVCSSWNWSYYSIDLSFWVLFFILPILSLCQVLCQVNLLILSYLILTATFFYIWEYWDSEKDIN